MSTDTASAVSIQAGRGRGLPPLEIGVASYVTAMTLLLWAGSDGLADLFAGSDRALLSVGRASGLLAALAALAGLWLAARPRRLESAVGLDTMLAWHRVLGVSTLVLVLVHAVADTLGWALAVGVTPLTQFLALLRGPWMVAAAASTGLLITIGLSSWRRIRRSMQYESWYFLHLTGYLAVLLAFGHQVTMGTDTSGGIGRWWWLLLFTATAIAIAWSRLGDLGRSLARGPATIAARRELTSEVTEITLHGGSLPSVQPGQYVGLRLLGRDSWWQVHPYSVAGGDDAVAGGDGDGGLRFAVKRVGDGSRALADAPIGSRVLLEGPYGVFTAARAHGAKVLLIAGGVGAAPIRAVLEQCLPQQQPIVVVRARSVDDVAYGRELQQLADDRTGTCHLLAGPRSQFAGGSPFHPDVLAEAVPDIAERHIFVCGPTRMEETVLRSLRSLRIPGDRIHRERFGY